MKRRGGLMYSISCVCTSYARLPAIDGVTYLVACHYSLTALFSVVYSVYGWLGSRVVSVLDSGTK